VEISSGPENSEGRGASSNPGWPCFGPLSTSAVALEKCPTQTPGAGPAARESARAHLNCRAISYLVCGDPPDAPAVTRDWPVTSLTLCSVEKVPAFCWLLCRTSNSLRQITKAGVLRPSVFQIRHFPLVEAFLGVPYRYQFYCRGGLNVNLTLPVMQDLEGSCVKIELVEMREFETKRDEIEATEIARHL
jgi:hypothetical protein